MIKRYYIDTSVFGGYFDSEFDKITHEFYNQIVNQNITIIYSELTRNELKNAPEKVKNFVSSIKEDKLEYIELTDEALVLADLYISNNVVGKTSREDCIHIALATVYKADVLVSWNFKHIVNLNRIRGYNSVNLKAGYPMIEIRSPLELIEYED